MNQYAYNTLDEAEATYSFRAKVRMEEMELAIEVRGAYKGYGSLRVLKGLDMSVPRGRM